MKTKKKLRDAFGLNAYGMVDLSGKVSGTQISRLLVGEAMECAYCFPHGIETGNSHWHNRQRNWKKQRKARWKAG